MPAALVRPCVCCREREHAGIPDRDLEGYVCRQCARLLVIAQKAAGASGIRGCVPEPGDRGQAKENGGQR